MKIAFFTDTYVPNKDGVVSSILATRRALGAMGHEVYVFTSGSRKDKKENRDQMVNYFTSTTFKPYPDYKIALFPFLAPNKLKKYKIDLIHTHGIATMGLAALQAAGSLKLPVVGTFHTMVTDATHYISKNKLVDRVAKQMIWNYLKWFFNRCDASIAPTATVKEIMSDHGIRRIEVAPSGIDLGRFPATNTPHDGTIGLYLGRVALEKNLTLLIESVPHIMKTRPDFRLTIAGRGPALDYYKKLVAQKWFGRWITFTGIIPDNELAAAYGKCDVFAMPSKFETQGLSVIEAMTCGKPVVASKYLALKEIVRNGYNGYLSDGNEPKEFAERILKALGEKGKLAIGARKTAERFSAEKCTKRLLEIYGQAIERNRERRERKK